MDEPLQIRNDMQNSQMNGTNSRWTNLARDKAETPLNNSRPKSGTSRVENYENVKIVRDQSGDLPAQF